MNSKVHLATQKWSRLFQSGFMAPFACGLLREHGFRKAVDAEGHELVSRFPSNGNIICIATVP